MMKPPNDDKSAKYYLIFLTIVFISLAVQSMYSDYLAVVAGQ